MALVLPTPSERAAVTADETAAVTADETAAVTADETVDDTADETVDVTVAITADRFPRPAHGVAARTEPADFFRSRNKIQLPPPPTGES